ncbi:nitronate monooxygenase family protein [Dietzia sp. B32]|uniref:NAD(P)H-dependent flavin oxidoreductase n=1 Tax=Dietzia sp. B32 TaxID=2915130 RepID=UPI0021ADCFD9|nr:nitronate monooxygenase [Dietzia sp. B32]UVE96789.1 nitronate monooxygenase [Dietzia sp. B32]
MTRVDSRPARARLLPSHLRRAVIGAPMAGGPTTPELIAAVGEAGGIAMIGSGYLDAAGTRAEMARVRELTDAPFGVNVFLLDRADSDAALSAAGGPGVVAEFAAAIGPVAQRLGVALTPGPEFTDFDQDATLDALVEDPVAVVSFTFGIPDPGVVRALQDVGSAVVVTVAGVADARRAVEVGADWLSVQSAEAGGHRSTTTVGEEPDDITTLALVRAVREELPETEFVAAGGISTPEDVAAVLAAGADGVQVGTVLLRTPEAGTSALHRAALGDPRFTESRPTRCYTGRFARSLVNEFVDEFDAAAPPAYPHLHLLTGPMRKAAAQAGDPEVPPLWAGSRWREADAYADRPAAEVVADLWDRAVQQRG